MAPIAASITVNFTANHTGQHRVCWRLGSLGPYDCTTIVPTTSGVAYSVVIPVTVDNESCSGAIFEGYVQPTCEPELSTTSRVPFSVNFTADPTCLPLLITCASVGIAEFLVVTPGSGYVVPPTVILSSGTGAGTAVLGVGEPTVSLITNNGGGALTPGVYPATAAVAISASGVGAQYDVEVDALGNINIADYIPGTGSGYVLGDTVNFPSITGSGAEIITMTTVDTGTIASITVDVPGSYSSTPTVTLSGAPDNASAAVILAPCAAGWSSGNNCLGDAYTAYPITPELGQAVALCNIGAVDPGTLPAGYVVSAGDPVDDCCYNCVDINISYANPGGDPVNYAYIDCNPINVTYRNFLSGTITDGNSVTINCVVKNSWALSSATGITIVESATSC